MSGSGTNLQAILDAAAIPGYPAEVALVLSDKLGVYALDRAMHAGVATEVVTWEGHGGDRHAFTQAIVAVLDKYEVDFVVLAGFMRILTEEICEAYPGNLLNTHPSLLPAFRGAHAVEDALASGVKIAGVTIHIVVPEVDAGPIIAQETVPVLPGDTSDLLHERIKQVEHRLFPEVIADWAVGRYVVDGDVVRDMRPRRAANDPETNFTRKDSE